MVVTRLLIMKLGFMMGVILNYGHATMKDGGNISSPQ